MDERPIPDLTIRFAVVDDIGRLVGQLYISSEDAERKIKSGEIAVALSDHEMIGFLQLEYLWSLVPYIGLLKVSDEYRCRRVGTALLDFVCEFLRTAGHKTIYSSSQADEPEPQAWHRRVGFEECGIINGINDGIGEIFFRRSI